MKKNGWKKLVVLCMAFVLTALTAVAPASAKAKGFVFKYKGVSVTMNGAAKKLIKKAGKPKKKVVKKSCAYKGKDRTYTYDDFQLKTYSKSNKGKEYVSEIRFRTSEVSTKEGIKIGSSLKSMMKKYGKATPKYGVYTYKKGKGKLQFIVENDQVTAIRYFATK